MKFDKLVKIIWFINGLFFLLGIPFLCWKIYEQEMRSYDIEPESLIVGEKVQEAKKKGLLIQGIVYDKPIQVAHTNSFILPIYAKTYEQPIDAESRQFIEIPPTAQPGFGGKLYGNYNYYANTSWSINILFLDVNYNVQGRLLDQKGFIESFRIPDEEYIWTPEGSRISDSTVNCITYSIAFKDTNNDGQLNAEDWTDLYISDLDGKRFVQVTSGLEVIDYHFMKDNSELLIEYWMRNDGQAENRKKYFASYNISSRALAKLNRLHQELHKIEQAIRE